MNQTLSQSTLLQNKLSQICKLSQDKHVIRMKLGRSNEISKLKNLKSVSSFDKTFAAKEKKKRLAMKNMRHTLKSMDQSSGTNSFIIEKSTKNMFLKANSEIPVLNEQLYDQQILKTMISSTKLKTYSIFSSNVPRRLLKTQINRDSKIKPAGSKSLNSTSSASDKFMELSNIEEAQNELEEVAIKQNIGNKLGKVMCSGSNTSCNKMKILNSFKKLNRATFESKDISKEKSNNQIRPPPKIPTKTLKETSNRKKDLIRKFSMDTNKPVTHGLELKRNRSNKESEEKCCFGSSSGNKLKSVHNVLNNKESKRCYPNLEMNKISRNCTDIPKKSLKKFPKESEKSLIPLRKNNNPSPLTNNNFKNLKHEKIMAKPIYVLNQSECPSNLSSEEDYCNEKTLKNDFNHLNQYQSDKINEINEGISSFSLDENKPMQHPSEDSDDTTLNEFVENQNEEIAAEIEPEVSFYEYSSSENSLNSKISLSPDLEDIDSGTHLKEDAEVIPKFTKPDFKNMMFSRNKTMSSNAASSKSKKKTDNYDSEGSTRLANTKITKRKKKLHRSMNFEKPVLTLPRAATSSEESLLI